MREKGLRDLGFFSCVEAVVGMSEGIQRREGTRPRSLFFGLGGGGEGIVVGG